MKKLLVFIISLLWVHIAFSEYPFDLKGEWIRACNKLPFGDRYFISKTAYFDDNKRILSWKLYDDSNCTKLRQVFWEEHEITFGDSILEQGVFLETSTLIDGLRSGCKKQYDILLRRGNELYFGEPDNSEGHCEKIPLELNRTPYIFSGFINQTKEEYIKSLGRYWVVDHGNYHPCQIYNVGETSKITEECDKLHKKMED